MFPTLVHQQLAVQPHAILHTLVQPFLPTRPQLGPLALQGVLQ
jgi:hypothetical protein